MNAREEATALLSQVGFAALLGEATREDWVELRNKFAEVLAYYEDKAIDAIRESDAARGLAESLAAEVDKLREESASISAAYRRAREDYERAEKARTHAQATADQRLDRLLGIARELGTEHPEDTLDNAIEIRELASPKFGESVVMALRRQLVPARAEIGDKQ